MKRYRGKNANYQRLGSAFVPARKWGKREKKKLARLNEGYTGPSAGNALVSPTYKDLASQLTALFGPGGRLVTGEGTKARQWIWTAPNKTQYTTITAPDGAEYIVTVDAAIRLAQPPTEPPSLEFTLPDVQDPKPFYSDAYEHKYRR